MRMRQLLAIFFSLFFLTTSAFAQTTAFNFQGRMNDGTSPANGRYDLQFKLFDAITAGSQVGSTVDKPNTMLVNGVFSAPLDFGATAFSPGNRFLEISVRPFNSPNAHVILGARQQILSVPLAVRAVNAAQADNATNAQNAANATTAATAQNSLSLGGILASGYVQLNTANPGAVIANGLGSTGLLQIQGNALQSAAATGFPKAMLYVESIPDPPFTRITRCFNGVTGSTTGTCGFTLIHSKLSGGIYRIVFDFPVTNRFVMVSVQYGSNAATDHNMGANYQFFNDTSIEVFTFSIENSADTVPADSMLIVY